MYTYNDLKKKICTEIKFCDNIITIVGVNKIYNTIYFTSNNKYFRINIEDFNNNISKNVFSFSTSTINFKIEEGTYFKESHREFSIIAHEYRFRNKKNGTKEKQKWYLCRCHVCNYPQWIEESHLLNSKIKQGCTVCSHKTSALGYNTIWDTDRWMCDLGVSEEDAKTHMRSSSKKIIVTCPNCGKQKQITPNKIYTRKSIGCSCGDKISYPEKFFISILNQLDIKYITQLSKKDMVWIDNQRYDFYLIDYNTIIEIHGEQHYKYTGFNRTLQEEQQNDKLKKELALNNGISNYIELDCRESNIKWIKNSIINSKLNNMFNLTTINWIQCESEALSNKIKYECELWNKENKYETITNLAKKLNIHRTTLVKHLKKGAKLGWCNYDPKVNLK